MISISESKNIYPYIKEEDSRSLYWITMDNLSKLKDYMLRDFIFLNDDFMSMILQFIDYLQDLSHSAESLSLNIDAFKKALCQQLEMSGELNNKTLFVLHDIDFTMKNIKNAIRKSEKMIIEQSQRNYFFEEISAAEKDYMLNESSYDAPLSPTESIEESCNSLLEPLLKNPEQDTSKAIKIVITSAIASGVIDFSKRVSEHYGISASDVEKFMKTLSSPNSLFGNNTKF